MKPANFVISDTSRWLLDLLIWTGAM